MFDTLHQKNGKPNPRRVKIAQAALAEADPTLGAFLRDVPFTLELSVLHDPFRALARAIIAQQISGAAARAIQERVRLFFQAAEFPAPEQLLSVTPEALRAAGLSRTKALSLQDLARKTGEGVVPTEEELAKLSDAAIIERLTEVRGIGVWTVQMMLIFRLGRTDVMASTDYGVRKGFGKLFLRGKLPTPLQVERRGARWGPYRSMASWYMWRVLES